MNMNLSEQSNLQAVTRRQFFSRCGVGLGGVALASLLDGGRLFGGGVEGSSPGASEAGGPVPGAQRGRHYRTRAKNVIYLFMAGAPSQLSCSNTSPSS